jgi:hypothetical protein
VILSRAWEAMAMDHSTLNRMDMESATTINGPHQTQRRETSLVRVQATMMARIRKPDPTTTIQKARRLHNKNKVQRRRQNRETLSWT